MNIRVGDIVFKLFILLLFGCKSEIDKPFPLPSQSLKENNKTRYFFIGYTISDQQRGHLYWMCNDGELPQKEEIIRFCHKSNKIRPFKDVDFIILSLYEFKNKQDRDFFMSH